MIKYEIKRELFEEIYRVCIQVYKEDRKDSKIDFNIFESNSEYLFARYMINEFDIDEFIRGNKDILKIFKYNKEQYKSLGNTNMLCIDCKGKFDLIQLEKIAKLVIEELDEIVFDYNRFEKICQSYKKSY